MSLLRLLLIWLVQHCAVHRIRINSVQHNTCVCEPSDQDPSAVQPDAAGPLCGMGRRCASSVGLMIVVRALVALVVPVQFGKQNGHTCMGGDSVPTCRKLRTAAGFRRGPPRAVRGAARAHHHQPLLAQSVECQVYGKADG